MMAREFWLRFSALSVAGLMALTGCAGQPASTTPIPTAALATEAPAEKPSESTDVNSAESAPASENSEPDSPAPAESPASSPAEPASESQPTEAPAEEAKEPAPEVAAEDAPKAEEPEIAHPFPRRFDLPDFPKDMEWINTGALSKRDIKGKFVLLDFWTYCCINCMHVLPELKKLEKKYPNELVVIGVHSAKFDTEKDAANIRSAVLRYEVEHPVVNDAEHEIWNMCGVSSWPTVLLVDPEGFAVWGRAGEFKFEEVQAVIERAKPYYIAKKLLDEKPIKFPLESEKEAPTPLRFPGKILADAAGQRLFISDSNHNRIVITSLDGKLIETIGSGVIGKADGSFAEASFDHPQGCALDGETLYVADTENHLLRKIDLTKKTVTTIAGTGKQAESAWPGIEEVRLTAEVPERWVGPPKTTGINSPWALWVHEKNLYIAMAGPHQIWKMPLDESEIGPYAGNGREDIVDGPLIPKVPYTEGFSSFAQPSGLSSDGEWLFVADSEGSSIRAVPFDPTKEVRTIVGTSELPGGRLFDFGDVDGPRERAKLQHALEVVYSEGKIYVADTYNNKIKLVDAKTGEVKTIAGSGSPGTSDDPATFDEPAGLALVGETLYVADTNNHLIRKVDVATGKTSTLTIEGLTPPQKPVAAKTPDFSSAKVEKLETVTLKPVDGKVTLQVKLVLPEGWKTNPLAPMSYYVDLAGESGPVSRAAAGKKKLAAPTSTFAVELPVTSDGTDEVTISLNYYYCEKSDEGVCKIGSVVFKVPLKLDAAAESASAELSHAAAE
ncbi:NHL repeat containing protein [Pirellula staleyi DSM 6068]|uniref:NHL repeat containing protein n=1 Tax=Pirellula staleyi (strain ATCC 27377 / DSM 6068 / ICPB 4128) TaxID=530564 RepID=D2QXE6_PIRSD|nr:thioredoxin-like domain-containing protein [Pirellula staleyi]ADB17986.1 NHL repeat containing protein [Pirellula staleyi DSM 6068]